MHDSNQQGQCRPVVYGTCCCVCTRSLSTPIVGQALNPCTVCVYLKLELPSNCKLYCQQTRHECRLWLHAMQTVASHAHYTASMSMY